MKKETIKKQLIKKYNACIDARLFVSWGLFLKTMYNEESRKLNHQKCAIIQDLIIEDINH